MGEQHSSPSSWGHTGYARQPACVRTLECIHKQTVSLYKLCVYKNTSKYRGCFFLPGQVFVRIFALLIVCARHLALAVAAEALPILRQCWLDTTGAPVCCMLARPHLHTSCPPPSPHPILAPLTLSRPHLYTSCLPLSPTPPHYLNP